MKPQKIKKEKRPFHSHHLTSNFWAFATILALPVTMFAANSAGASYVASFFAGIIGVLFVLSLDACLETKLWLFTPEWRARFESPDFSFRLAVSSGVIFLMLETILLFMFFTSPSMDRSLVELVFARQCGNPQGDFVQICHALGAESDPSQETE